MPHPLTKPYTIRRERSTIFKDTKANLHYNSIAYNKEKITKKLSWSFFVLTSTSLKVLANGSICKVNGISLQLHFSRKCYIIEM